jgi:hypothetical protein
MCSGTGGVCAIGVRTGSPPGESWADPYGSRTAPASEPKDAGPAGSEPGTVGEWYAVGTAPGDCAVGGWAADACAAGG